LLFIQLHFAPYPAPRKLLHLYLLDYQNEFLCLDVYIPVSAGG
jgi:hypothetical protein